MSLFENVLCSIKNKQAYPRFIQEFKQGTDKTMYYMILCSDNGAEQQSFVASTQTPTKEEQHG